MDKRLHELYSKEYLKEKPIMEKTLYQYFNDELDLDKLYFIKLSGIRELRNHNTRVELELDILENEIIRILEKDNNQRTEEEIEILNNAKSYYSKLYTINPLCALSCKIYDDEVSKKLFSNEAYNQIKEFNENISLKSEEYYQKYINNESLLPEEIEILFEYLTEKIGTEDINLSRKQEKIIKKLLSKEENYPLTAKNFLMKFVSHEKCKKLGLPDVRIYVGNKDPWNEKHDTYGCFFDEEKIILIDEEYLKESPMKISEKDGVENRFSFIKTISHETEHYKQVCYTQKNLVSKSTIDYIKSNLFRKYFTSKAFDEYEHNYEHREIEIEANIAGWHDTLEIFNKYAPNKINQKIIDTSSFIEKSKTYAYYQKNESSFVIPIDSNISLLREIILKHPQEVGNYPQLLYFFNSKGRLKDTGELIKGYQTLLLSKDYSAKEKENIKNAYQEFFRYKLINTDLNEIDLARMTDNDQNVLFSVITKEFELEIQKLKDMMDIYSNINENKKKFVNENAYGRIERIKKYYDYLSKNKKNIYNSSKKASLKDFEILDLKELSNILKTLKFNITSIDGTDLGDEIIELSKYGKKK